MSSISNKTLSQKIASHNINRPFYSFEFFPPRTDQVCSLFEIKVSVHLAYTALQGFENLVSRIERLSTLNPLAISVTWGAGGSTKDRSLELASMIQKTGFDTIIHLTCTNMQMGLVDEALKVCLVQELLRHLHTTRAAPRQLRQTELEISLLFVEVRAQIRFIIIYPLSNISSKIRHGEKPNG